MRLCFPSSGDQTRRIQNDRMSGFVLLKLEFSCVSLASVFPGHFSGLWAAVLTLCIG